MNGQALFHFMVGQNQWCICHVKVFLAYLQPMCEGEEVNAQWRISSSLTPLL